MSAELLPLPIAPACIYATSRATDMERTVQVCDYAQAYARANIAKVEAERDAARAEVARLREAVMGLEEYCRRSSSQAAPRCVGFVTEHNLGRASALDFVADELATITDNRERGE